MKILILNSLYPPYVRGGAELSIQHLAESLVQVGNDVVVVATVPQPQRRTLIDGGVKVLFVGPANFHWPYDGAAHSGAMRKLWHAVDLYNPWMRRVVADIIRCERPDVVHTNNLQGLSIAAWHAAAAAGRPILHTLRDYSLSCSRSCRYRQGRICASTCWDCRPFAAARRRASALVEGVIGNSRSILDRHSELGFFSQARVRAVVHPSFPVVSRSSPAARDKVVFGYLGRLEAAKGVDLVVDEFSRRQAGGWELQVAGTGLESFVRGLQARGSRGLATGAIRFLGWLEAEAFLRAIDVLIVPSRWDEPLPRVVLEAAAYGVPVIGARRGGIPEVIAHGVSGLLFDPDRTETLTVAVDELLNSPARRHALAEGAAEAWSAFAPETTSRLYQNAYAELMGALR